MPLRLPSLRVSRSRRPQAIVARSRRSVDFCREIRCGAPTACGMVASSEGRREPRCGAAFPSRAVRPAPLPVIRQRIESKVIRSMERPSVMERSPPRSQGFTLIEVMVVVVILGLLAAIIVPKVMSRPDEARVVAARADLAAINQALKLYRLDNTYYPSTEQGLLALVQRPATQPAPANWKQGGYLDRVPKVPWGREYLYLNPGVRSEIDVFSLGADGQAGGEGINADIYQ